MNLEKILKYLILAGVVVLMYVPFVVSNGLFFPYIVGKAYLFRITVEIIFFIWVILAVLYKEYRPNKNWLTYSALAFLIITFIANYFGVNHMSSFWSNFERMEGWVTIVHLVALYFVASSTLKEKKDWKLILNTSLLFSVFMVFKSFSEISEYGLNRRVLLTLGNSTYVGIYMLMHSFIALYLLVGKLEDWGLKFKYVLKKPGFWLYVVSFILTSVTIFQTGTRGSMLGWFGGLLLIGALMIYFGKDKKVKKYSLYGMLAVGIVMAGIFLLKDTSLIQNNEPLKRITTISINEGTAKARILNWQMATEGFKERPILGWGQSNFNYVFDKHYLPAHHGNEVWFDRVHNIFFDWLIAGGILGLLSYLSLWFAFVYLTFKTDKLSGNQKSVILALMAGYFFHNLFVFDQIVSYIYFFLILSFISSLHADKFKFLQKDISKELQYFKVGLAVVLIPVTIYFVNVPSYYANTELIEAIGVVNQLPNGSYSYKYPNQLRGNIEMFEQAIDRGTLANPEIRQRIIVMFGQVSRIENIDQQQLSEYIELAVTQMQQQIEEDPLNSKYYYLLGALYGNLGQYFKAEEQFLKAIELSPNKQAIRVPLIITYRNTDRLEQAVNLAKETYELDKSKDDIWKMYAETLSVYDVNATNNLVNDAIAEGRVYRIVGIYESNLRKDPQSYQDYLSLAALHMRVGEKDMAVVTMERLRENVPQYSAQADNFINLINAGVNPWE